MLPYGTAQQSVRIRTGWVRDMSGMSMGEGIPIKLMDGVLLNLCYLGFHITASSSS